MAAAFRSGVTVGQISTAYGVSAEWAMKLIRERLGVEAVGEIIEMRHYNTCEMCGLRIGVDDEYAIVNDKRVHMDCVGEHLDT